ncbi:hypothetical protein K0M31_017728 [Melipona bicolor]|uniref:Uncharacterized protein n=1 Tax=Melipona bicolor TaxID=60889 RepID=A0AA40KSQ7_9HYME|nr:hypothetical protein K0M31_017728 [Melipona bicolor]
MTTFQEWESSNTTALVTYFALELTTIIGMFTNCFVGQLLIDEGNIVKQISNTLDWHQLPVKKARYLTLIIITSNNPMTVTVANMIQLSLITFIDVSISNIVTHKSLRKEHFTRKTSVFNYSNPPIVQIPLLCDDCGTTRKNLFGKTKIWF